MSWEPLPGDRDTTHDLNSSLEKLHRSIGLARPNVLRTLEDQWDSLLGAPLARSARLESIHQGQLVIAVDDPVVAEAVRWQSADIIGAANALCGGQVLQTVVTKVRPRGSFQAT